MNSDTRDNGRPTLASAMTTGAWRFAVVSVCAFSVWAFAGRPVGKAIGEGGLYAVITLVFLALAGLLMHPLARGPRAVQRFYSVFVPAFVVYAALWSVAWFTMGFGAGEWIGAAAGSLVFVAICAWRLGSFRSFAAVAAGFFVVHTAGYFAGGYCMGWLKSPEAAQAFSSVPKRALVRAGMLAWGVGYGLGFGAGLGLVFRAFQSGAEAKAGNTGK